ncbi:uncharacterized protein TrAtP1_007906 [Trichoderma atroviride]|uniref:uncharacterized protein n=1 Tax=Hypocrea atroviridis TaxID=63577 RepID=UPI00332FC02F|nr:hypothetical protein TrAtP1_007906 [Trichoderma atroviride]
MSAVEIVGGPRTRMNSCRHATGSVYSMVYAGACLKLCGRPAEGGSSDAGADASACSTDGRWRL